MSHHERQQQKLVELKQIWDSLSERIQANIAALDTENDAEHRRNLKKRNASLIAERDAIGQQMQQLEGALGQPTDAQLNALGQAIEHLKARLDELDKAAAEDWAQIEADYRQAIHKEYHAHILRGFAPRVNTKDLSLPLAEIFLPLQAVEGKPQLAQYAERDLQQELRFDHRWEWTNWHEELERRRAQYELLRQTPRTFSLRELLTERRVVLLGDPGAGKTTLTRYIALALADRDFRHISRTLDGYLPVLIRIANYGKAYEHDRTLQLIDFIERTYDQRPAFGRLIRQRIEAGRCVLLLDGLDEVTNPHLRFEVTDQIQKFVAIFDANRFIVTSRVVGYDRSPLTAEFRHATLKDMTPDEQSRFIRLWHRAFTDAGLKTQPGQGDAESLITALTERPTIARMAANPLLLTIIVLMHWRGTHLPNQRVQVYAAATDTLVEYWMSTRQANTLDASEVKSILQPIAHALIANRVSGVIAENELIPKFKQGVVEVRGVSEKQADAICKEMLRDLNEQSGLLLERGRDENHQPVYGFLHQTFGEYLAGLHLATVVNEGQIPLEKFLETHLHRAAWREPLLLALGHLAENTTTRARANQLIEAILAFPAPYEPTLQRNTLFVADALADGLSLAPALRDRILESLADLLLNHPAPQVQNAALEDFRALGNTLHKARAIEMLERQKSLLPKILDDVNVENYLRLARAFVAVDAGEIAAAMVETRWKELYNYSAPNEIERLVTEARPKTFAQTLMQTLRPDDLNPGQFLGKCYLGPANAAEWRLWLGKTIFEDWLTALQARLSDLTLTWSATLHQLDYPETTIFAQERLRDFLTSSSSDLRLWAALHLLEGQHRVDALKTLYALRHKPEATAALHETGGLTTSNWDAICAYALFEYDGWDEGPNPIELLLRTENAQALVIWLFTHKNDSDLAQRVLEAWLVCGHTELGRAAAEWLALQGWYSYRVEACLCVRDFDPARAAVLLERAAYELTGSKRQKACQALVAQGEGQRAAPLLAAGATSKDGKICYLACQALVVLEAAPKVKESSSLWSDLCKTYESETRAAQAQFYTAAQNTLRILPAEQAEWGALAALSLKRWVGQTLTRADFELFASTSQSLVCFWAGWLLQELCFDGTEFDLMASALPSLEPRAAAFAAIRLTERRDSRVFDALIIALRNEDRDVRQAAANALGELCDPQALEPLLTALHDEDRAVRQAAAKALGILRDPQALESLITILHDRDGDVRSAAADALGALRDLQALEPLIIAIRDEDSDVRQAATKALGVLHEPRSLESLLAALHDRDSDVRSAAMDALRGLHNPEMLESLIIALRNKDANVRKTAANALDALRDPQALEPLINALNDEDNDVRRAATKALGALRDLGALEALILALRDKDANVRRLAVNALGALRDPQALEPLITTLQDKNAKMRRLAANALGALCHPQALKPLIIALRDENSDVRQAAAKALGVLRGSQALEPLIIALRDENSDVRQAAAKALGALRGSQALEPLIIALRDENSDVRQAAAKALGALRGSQALEPLIIALRDENSDVRQAAAKALGALHNLQALGALIIALRDEEHFVRNAAVNAVGALRDSQALEPLLAALRDEEINVRQGAVNALGVMRDPQALEPLIVALRDESLSVQASAINALGQLHDSRVYNFLLASLHSFGSTTAKALARLDKPEAAKAIFVVSHTADTDDIEDYIRSLAHLAPVLAQQALERYEQKFPEPPELARVKGVVWQQLGQATQAEMAFGQANANSKASVEDRLACVVFLWTQGRESETLSLLETAKTQANDKPLYHNDKSLARIHLSLAITHWLLGAPEAALAALKQARYYDYWVIDADDRRFDDFWGERALAALQALVAAAEAAN